MASHKSYVRPKEAVVPAQNLIEGFPRSGEQKLRLEMNVEYKCMQIYEFSNCNRRP